MIVLGIETTCDETAFALVASGHQILSNVLYSQASIHKGGVHPERAAREHLSSILPLLDECLNKASLSLAAIDLIAVSYGPGLVGSIQIGLQTAKTLSVFLKKPFIAVNHLEAHLYASIMGKEPPLFPALGLLVSGGHTALVLLRSETEMSLLGTTADDALGESFDKVASLMGLPYPGGPHIEQLAKKGHPSLPFKAGQLSDDPFGFSFSGLKTQVRYAIEQQKGSFEDIASSFQRAAFTDLYQKSQKAYGQLQCRSLLFGGGVTQSDSLRSCFAPFDAPLYFAKKELCLDNGAMVAGYGFPLFKQNGPSPLSIRATPKIRWKRALS